MKTQAAHRKSLVSKGNPLTAFLKRLFFYVFLFGSAVLLTGCSTKKDRFINREWHALNSKFNVIFNGEMAFQQAWDGLQDGYQENFWEPLPIDRFAPKHPTQIASATTQSPFALAEQKAAKAIA